MPTISKERLKKLLEDEAILTALEAGGVDNWEWYELSLDGKKDIPDDHPELLVGAERKEDQI